jgi:hypothetical protein
MSLWKRLALATGVVVLAISGYAAWYVYGAWPVPDGYSFPRHSFWGGGPAALFEGKLHDSGGCIRTAGTQHFTVVWPPGYRLTLAGGQPVVQGGGRDLRMGELVRMGGGFYEDGDPPPTTFDLGSCPPPYFLSTGFVGD